MILTFFLNCRHSNDDYYDQRQNQTPNNKIIVRGLASHLTEADVSILLRFFCIKYRFI